MMNAPLATAVLLLGTAVSPPPAFTDADMQGVWCSSRDGGKTCWGYSETNADGTIEACGRVPGTSVEFAMILSSESNGATRCETVLKTTHPNVLPVGERFCSRLVAKSKDEYSYVFTDGADVREVYRRPKAEMWCQPAIDALR